MHTALMFFILTFAGAAILCRLALNYLAPESELKSAAHWTERARLLYPARKALPAIHPLLAAIAAVLGAIYALVSDKHEHTLLFSSAFALLSVLGTLAAHFQFARKHFAHANRVQTWLRELGFAYLPTIFEFILFFGSILALIRLLSLPLLLSIALASLVVYTIALFGGTLIPLYLFGYLRKATDELETCVFSAAQQMGIKRKLRIFEVGAHTAYAGALPFPSVILVSKGLMGTLNAEELAVIVRHELVHIRESWTETLARYLPSALSVPLVFLLAFLAGDRLFDYPIISFLLCFAFLHFLGMLHHKISIALEKRADSGAMQGELNEGTYARALEKIYEQTLTPAMLYERLGTHPELYMRMESAGVTPSYPKPLAPKTLKCSRVLATLFVGLILPVVALLASIDPSTGQLVLFTLYDFLNIS